MKGTSKPEIYLLLNMNMSPLEIMALGYPKSTCYYYFRRYKVALETMKKLLAKNRK
jgi:hypothetical protein